MSRTRLPRPRPKWKEAPCPTLTAGARRLQEGRTTMAPGPDDDRHVTNTTAGQIRAGQRDGDHRHADADLRHQRDERSDSVPTASVDTAHSTAPTMGQGTEVTRDVVDAGAEAGAGTGTATRADRAGIATTGERTNPQTNGDTETTGARHPKFTGTTNPPSRTDTRRGFWGGKLTKSHW